MLLLQVDLPGTYDNVAKMHAFYTEVTRRVRTVPGVLAVGAVSDFFIHRQPDYHVALEGQPAKREEDPAHPLTEDQVLPGFFEAMRIPLLRGRLLQESDLAKGAPQVIVINEEMARRFWPDQDPIGKRLKYGLDPKDPADATKDCNGDGYTNIEKYLNGLDPKVKTEWKDLRNNRDTLYGTR